MSKQLELKAAMLKRWVKIITRRTAVAVNQGPGKYYKIGEIGGYYNDLTGKVSPNTILDEGGIPISLIAGGKRVHFPIAVFQYALGCWDKALIENWRSEELLFYFLRCAEWTLEAQREDGSWDAFGSLGSSKYTVSSMAQGEGASLLVRAGIAFADEKYIDAAKAACQFMLKPYEKGGTCCRVGNDLYLEEYPQDPRRSVMNGWIFSLFGLYDLSLVESSFSESFEASTSTLARHLDDYDLGYWSYYDLERRIASPFYHRLHIAQLRVMSDLTNNQVFSIKAQKFEDYQTNAINVSIATFYKMTQKILEKADMQVLQ